MKKATELWDEHVAVIFSGSEPDLQVFEMKKAFYYGLYAAMQEIHDLGWSEVSEDDGIESMGDFIGEIWTTIHKEFIEPLETKTGE